MRSKIIVSHKTGDAQVRTYNSISSFLKMNGYTWNQFKGQTLPCLYEGFFLYETKLEYWKKQTEKPRDGKIQNIQEQG